MKTIIFFGYSGSGKTTNLSVLCRALVKKGFKVGTIKRIHDSNFTIDKRGKDTWQHTRAGASVVVAIAPREISIVRNESKTNSIRRKELLSIFRKLKVDYLLVEGLHKKFEASSNVKGIICAKSVAEASDLAREHPRRILFITGKFASQFKEKYVNNMPVLSLPRDRAKAMSLIVRGKKHRGAG